MSFRIEGCCLKKYSGDDEIVYIPSTVTQIDAYAFPMFHNLKKIVCPEGLTTLSYAAVADCGSLEEIELPSTLKKIGEECFLNCDHLKSIKIPDGVEEIGERAFKGCTSLSSISIPENIQNLSLSIFEGCRQIPQNHELFISNHICFGGVGRNGHVEIPEGVQKIASEAFARLDITSVSIPSTVAEIPYCAFNYCTKLSVVKLTEGLTKIGALAFHGCQGLSEIHFPESLEEFNYGSFMYCTSLNHVAIPGKVTRLPHNLFQYCYALNDIVIPNSVNSIGEFCFDGCGFHSWTTPPGVSTFGCCYIGGSVKELYIASAEQTVDDLAYSGCRGLQTLYVDDSITTFGRDYLSTSVPNLHISVRGISPLSADNKINAIVTYLRNPELYSKQAQKDWNAYIRRRKMELFSVILKAEEPDIMGNYLRIVEFSMQESDVIKEMSQASVLLPIVQSLMKVKKAKKQSNSSGTSLKEKSRIGQLIAVTSKQASNFKKVVLLEAAILFGTTEDVEMIWKKFSPFEFLDRAICLCVRLGNLEKLDIILQDKRELTDTEYHPAMKAKYGSWNNTVFLSQIIEPTISRCADAEEMEDDDPLNKHEELEVTVQNAVNQTFYQSSAVLFNQDEIPPRETQNLVEAIKKVDAWGGMRMSDFIAYALLHGRVSLAKALIDAGYSLDGKSIQYLFEVYDPKIRRDVFYALSVSTVEDRTYILDCLFRAAAQCGKQIVLSSVVLDYTDQLFDPITFRSMICSCDCSKLKSKDLLEKLIQCGQSENLEYFLNTEQCHITKNTAIKLLNYSERIHQDPCNCVLKSYLNI